MLLELTQALLEHGPGSQNPGFTLPKMGRSACMCPPMSEGS